MSNKGIISVPQMGFRVKSEILPKEMDVTGFFCPSPGCPCKEVTLYFYEADDTFSIELFKLVINYETWRLVSTEIYKDDEDYARIIHEFMDGLNDKIKSMILSRKEEAVAKGPVLRDDIDYSELSMNQLVCYPDIYNVYPYEQFIFEFDSTRYFVLDFYCPNPKCDCRDVFLTFQVMKDNNALSSPVLEYRIKFKTGKTICERKDASISAQYAEELFAVFLKYIDERGSGIFKERYARIKEWGKDSLQSKLHGPSTSPVSVGPKIGRNAPCPCGSGKKYKRCCGR